MDKGHVNDHDQNILNIFTLKRHPTSIEGKY